MIEQLTETAKFASVDIGSNAVRFMVKTANHQPNGLINSTVLMYMRVPIRLGEDVFLKGKVSDFKIKQLVQMMKSVRHLLKVCGVQNFRACATSALREAKNSQKVVDIVAEKSKLNIEVISGKEEARLLYANRQIENKKSLQMYVDVGGGSTEISLIRDGQVIESHSFKVGTVRMLVNATASDVMDNMHKDVVDLASRYSDIHLVGSGGNIEKYYNLSDQKDKVNKLLPISSLRDLYVDLSSLSIDERVEKYSLKRDRADVIVPAGEIFLTVADGIGAKEIKVPMYGVADGIVADMIRKYWNENQ